MRYDEILKAEIKSIENTIRDLQMQYQKVVKSEKYEPMCKFRDNYNSDVCFGTYSKYGNSNFCCEFDGNCKRQEYLKDIDKDIETNANLLKEKKASLHRLVRGEMEFL